MYPYNREWLIDSINIERYTIVKRNWDESKKLISSIREHLSTIDAEIASKIYTIATAGSLGRMEASPDVSDLDLILVLSDDIDPDSEIASDIYKSVWKALEPLKLQLPKSTGVFADSTSQKQLISDIGKANERYEVFGKRLLILLESQPLYQDSNYTNLIRVIVERYADSYLAPHRTNP